MFTKILVANRGEIAVRIIRACHALGIQAVAVCSTADADALPAQLADECVCIGNPAPQESYLKGSAIIEAALATGCQAVHPGYGFLSERSDFARLCEENGLAFIGPVPDIIDRMGNKSQARRTMMGAGVPVVPGTKQAVYSVEEALPLAREIDWPIMIKASSGGGGKGMRVSESEDDFAAMFNVAQRESVNGFDDDTMYLERAVMNPRHVEVQVIADSFGNVVSLGERDCSVQRNHQKMIEESPCPALPERVRREMGEAAVRAAKAVGYTSAGTIEFLVDQDANYYFMEMNTRVQVEHPVTEMVSGFDIMREMIRVAAGERLSVSQEDAVCRGCAIECRINAEQPNNKFLPSPGTITALHLPGGNGVRVDTAAFAGCSIPPYYDSLVAKIIVHAENRAEALAKMDAALDETVILGINTNLDFQQAIIRNSTFRNGEANTGFIEKFLKGEL